MRKLFAIFTLLLATVAHADNAVVIDGMLRQAGIPIHGVNPDGTIRYKSDVTTLETQQVQTGTDSDGSPIMGSQQVPVTIPGATAAQIAQGDAIAAGVLSSVPLAKEAKLNELQAAYSAAITAPIAYMGTTFVADSATQDMLGKVLAGLGGASFPGEAWRDTTGAPIPMTTPELQGLASAMVMRGFQADANLQTKKAAVAAAATGSAVQAVAW